MILGNGGPDRRDYLSFYMTCFWGEKQPSVEGVWDCMGGAGQRYSIGLVKRLASNRNVNYGPYHSRGGSTCENKERGGGGGQKEHDRTEGSGTLFTFEKKNKRAKSPSEKKTVS